MTKVSILIVNYNYSEYLDERIQSFLNQTYQDFELIIVDNGSTDRSVEVINKYTKDPRVSAKYYPKNDLFYKRWNDTVEIAQGKYLMFASSDDSCDPQLLEKLVEKLDSYPSVGFAYSQSWAIDDQGKRFRLLKDLTDHLDSEHWAKDYVNFGKEEAQYLLFSNPVPCSGAALIRRSVFIQIGKFDIQLRYSADKLLWAKALMISDVAYVAEPLNNYRSHPTSFTNATVSKSIDLEDKLRVFEYLLQKIKLPEEQWKMEYQGMLKWWMRCIFFEGISMSSSLKIYRLFKKIDPHINRRIIENCWEVFKKKLFYFMGPF